LLTIITKRRYYFAFASWLLQFITMEGEITAVLPSLDPIITDYSVGFLTHAATSTSPEADLELAEAISAVTQILLDAAPPSLEQEKIKSLVSKLVAQLEEKYGGPRKQSSSQSRRLDQAIHVASHKSISATMGLLGSGVDIDAVGTRKVESRVDKKKLEKAERKIKAKQDKKVMKNVTYEASKLVTADDQKAYEEFYMTVNPLTLDSSSGKSKDIKVEGVDLSISGLRILTDTTLTLAYGRRYGLVGKNGIGKSTLLRALSRREVAIPTHITILHVEQEVKNTFSFTHKTCLTFLYRLWAMIHLLYKQYWTPTYGGNT
jgi:ATP-binding cassette subfamily F protein 3